MKSFLSLPLFSVALTLIGAGTRTTFAAPDQTSNPFVVVDEDVYVYKPVAPAAESAAPYCKYKTVKEFCDDALDVESQFYEKEYSELHSFCYFLGQMHYLSQKDGGKNSLLNEDEDFTIFAATNNGYSNFFLEILGTTTVGSTAIVEALEYSIVAGTKFKTIDLECKDKVDIISTKPGPKPKITCTEDIGGTKHAYIKGRANKGDYIPKFVDPNNAIKRVCNANIFVVDNLVLLNVPAVNL